MQRTSIELRLARARSWYRRVEKLEDLCQSSDVADDEVFIFYWIAFNALYGQPKYHHKGEKTKPSVEEQDIQRFLGHMIRLGGKLIGDKLRQRQDEMKSLIEDPFLCDWCWKNWDARKVVGKEQRIESGCGHKGEGDTLTRLFRRLYVLRKQLMRGCSTRRGSRNREMLNRSVALLRSLLPVFCEITEAHLRDRGLVQDLRHLPYPPSVWNP